MCVTPSFSLYSHVHCSPLCSVHGSTIFMVVHCVWVHSVHSHILCKTVKCAHVCHPISLGFQTTCQSLSTCANTCFRLYTCTSDNLSVCLPMYIPVSIHVCHDSVSALIHVFQTIRQSPSNKWHM